VSTSEAQWQQFEQLLEAGAYDSAWRYCCLLARTREDAQDLLSDALAQALRSFGQLRDAASFRGWLLSIVRSRFLNGERRRRTERRHGEQLARIHAPVHSDPLAAQVALALEALPSDQRLPLTLFYLEGLSLRETARALGLGPAALQSRLHRARAALKRQLQLCLDAARNPAQSSEECHARG
jgi:RNA polymerase sigma factor (sigma-70 family)